MNEKQLNAATQAMVKWLSDKHELGKAPNKMECAGVFDYHEMHYYIFKYKVSIFGKWLVGVCGGFEGDDLMPCGHIFSERQIYNETTAQSDCIKMIEMVMEYWKRQAKAYGK